MYGAINLHVVAVYDTFKGIHGFLAESLVQILFLEQSLLDECFLYLLQHDHGFCLIVFLAFRVDFESDNALQ